ncbi:MAG: hypothetical protein ACOCQR_03835 [bacterium]
MEKIIDKLDDLLCEMQSKQEEISITTESIKDDLLETLEYIENVGDHEDLKLVLEDITDNVQMALDKIKELEESLEN